jgi:hypothetical protein
VAIVLALLGLVLAASPAFAADGTGMMTVSPTYVVEGNTLTTLTFTFTAANTMSGDISISVPGSWPNPQTTNTGAAGYMQDDCTEGGVSTSGATYTSTEDDLGPGDVCTIAYENVTAPTTTGNYTFTTKESSTPGGTLTNIASQPVVKIGNDGTGTLTVSPTQVVAGTSSNTLTFTYTAAATVPVSSGELTIAVPSGWSTPSTSASAAGATTTTCSGGSVAISSSTIQVSGFSLSGGSSCTVTYGNKTSGPGATSPAAGGFQIFSASQEATNDSNLIALKTSPNVIGAAPDGSGTMTVSPTQVATNSTNVMLTFTFTASALMPSGKLALTIPAGWTAPQNTNFGAAGFINDGCNDGGEALNSRTFSDSEVDLSQGDACTITYGPATAPGSSVASMFAVQEASTASGTLTNVATQPVVNVGNDGTGTLTVSPTQVTAGTSGNTLTFTYTAAATISSGELTIAVPSGGWSTPSPTSGTAGYTTTTCPSGSVGVSGSTIQVSGFNLSNGNTCTVTYGDRTSGGPGATSSSAGGFQTFSAQEESTSDNNLLALHTSPIVSGVAADGSGTMTVAPSQVTPSHAGVNLTFTFTAAANMPDGELTIAVPSGWGTPQTSSPGGVDYVQDDCTNGAPSFSVGTYTSPDVELGQGNTCTIEYENVTSPATTSAYTFTTKDRSTTTGTLTNVATQPVVNVGSDGTGTLTVSPTQVTSGTSGHTLTFTYTAGASISGGELTIALPSGWSAPSAVSGTAGYTTTTCSGGSVGVSGSTIQVSGFTLASGTCTVTYGNLTGGGPGASSPATGGFETFTAQEKSSSGGTLTALGSSPTITVVAADGTGTMTVSPTNVVNSSTGNELTFTYTAANGSVNNGELTITVPSGWSTPQTTNGNSPGYVFDSCGTSVSVSTRTIQSTGVDVGSNASCEIIYGLAGGGATAPAPSGPYAFTIQEKSSSTGTLTSLSSSPVVNVDSDGVGSLGVSPGSTSAGSQGNTLTFTYTSPAGVGLTGGKVTVAIPGGWSAPSITGTDPGYTTTNCSGGSVSVNASTIQVSGINLGTSSQCTITYGDTSAGGDGATATSTLGASTFSAEEESSSSGGLAALSTSPQLTVDAADGSGTMSASPSFVGPGSGGNTLTFTYTAAASGGVAAGGIEIAAPSGWSVPSTTGGAAGYTTATCGSVSASGQTIQVTGVSVGPGASCTIKYGDKSLGGTGASAPSSPGTSTFGAEEKSTGSGTLTALALAPVVKVTSTDGSGAMTVSPTGVQTGSTDHTLTFTYTAATGGLGGGKLTLAVPTGWSAPSTTGSDPGFTSSDCGTVGVSGTTVQVTGVTLAGTASCTIVYGSTASGGSGASAPSSDGSSAFSAQEASTSSGTLTALGISPSVSTTTFPTLTVNVSGSGTVSGGSISCPGTCSQTSAPGTMVALSAQPASGFSFSGWGGACSGAGDCSVTLDADRTVTATFTKNSRLTVSVSGSGTVSGGSISCPGTCSETVTAGTVVGLTAHPASGFSFSGWSGACTGTGDCSVTLTADKSVTATFKKNSAPPPPAVKCTVPKLKGDSLSKAESLLRKAHCAVGKVTKPKPKKGHKQPKLVVGSTKPKAGTKLAKGSKVAITLVAAPKKK